MLVPCLQWFPSQTEFIVELESLSYSFYISIVLTKIKSMHPILWIINCLRSFLSKKVKLIFFCHFCMSPCDHASLWRHLDITNHFLPFVIAFHSFGRHQHWYSKKLDRWLVPNLLIVVFKTEVSISHACMQGSPFWCLLVSRPPTEVHLTGGWCLTSWSLSIPAQY